MAHTVHALVMSTVLLSIAVSLPSTTAGLRSLLDYTYVNPAPATALGASLDGFIANTLPPLDYPIPGQDSPLNFTITIANTTDTSAAPGEPAHCIYCIQSASGCTKSSQGPLVIGLPPSSFAQVNFSVPVFPDASAITVLMAINGTIQASEPTPGGLPESLGNQDIADYYNGSVIQGFYSPGWPTPENNLESLTGVSFTTKKNATIGYTIPMVAGLAANATYDFLNPWCYINIDFVVKGPANLAPGAGPGTLAPGAAPATLAPGVLPSAG